MEYSAHLTLTMHLNDVGELTLMSQSHSELVKNMKDKYDRDTTGTEEDDEDIPVAALMEIELPFFCDNVFKLTPEQ